MAYGKKTEKNRGKYIFGCIVMVFAITYLVFNSIDAWYKYQESKKRLQASINSLNELSNQYEELRKQKALEESSTGYEMHIRSKFDMNKPEENVVFIVNEETEQYVPEEKGIKKMMNKLKNFFN
jgi:hypothetical protein